METAPLLAVTVPPRVTFALEEEASGAEVRPLLEVALALEALRVTVAARVWV